MSGWLCWPATWIFILSHTLVLFKTCHRMWRFFHNCFFKKEQCLCSPVWTVQQLYLKGLQVNHGAATFGGKNANEQKRKKLGKKFLEKSGNSDCQGRGIDFVPCVLALSLSMKLVAYRLGEESQTPKLFSCLKRFEQKLTKIAKWQEMKIFRPPAWKAEQLCFWFQEIRLNTRVNHCDEQARQSCLDADKGPLSHLKPLCPFIFHSKGENSHVGFPFSHLLLSYRFSLVHNCDHCRVLFSCTNLHHNRGQQTHEKYIDP